MSKQIFKTGSRPFIIRIAFLTMLFVCPFLFASNISEDEIKAAFIFNFARFVEWPELKNAEELVVGYLGTRPLGGNLELLKGRKINDRKINVKPFVEAEASQFDLVFISAVELGKKPEAIDLFHERPILTVSDAPDFIHSGGIIGLIIVNKKVCFEINQTAALADGLKISSQLLSLARRVL